MPSAMSGKMKAQHSLATVTATGPAPEGQAKVRVVVWPCWTQLLESWSRTQDSVTLSSVEAELVALSTRKVMLVSCTAMLHRQ